MNLKGPKPMSGRQRAGMIGGILGLALSAYILGSNYEIVKFTPPETNPDGSVKAKKFNIRFAEMQPLKLKPEVAAKQEQVLKEKEERDKLMKDIEEREQIVQEPTS